MTGDPRSTALAAGQDDDFVLALSALDGFPVRGVDQASVHVPVQRILFVNDLNVDAVGMFFIDAMLGEHVRTDGRRVEPDAHDRLDRLSVGRVRRDGRGGLRLPAAE